MIVNKSLTSLHRFESYNIRHGCLAKWLKQQFVKLCKLQWLMFSSSYFVLWCNGSTTDFDSVSGGSNPPGTTITNASFGLLRN